MTREGRAGGWSCGQGFMGIRGGVVLEVTAQPLDVGQRGDVENPEDAVVDEQSILIEVVKDDEDEQRQRPANEMDLAPLPGRPERAPAADPAQGEEKHAGTS